MLFNALTLTIFSTFLVNWRVNLDIEQYVTSRPYYSRRACFTTMFSHNAM
jgi:hypothetical protein